MFDLLMKGGRRYAVAPPPSLAMEVTCDRQYVHPELCLQSRIMLPGVQEDAELQYRHCLIAVYSRFS